MSFSKKLTEDHGQLLTFSSEESGPQQMASLSLFYPCLALATLVDPATLREKDGANAYSDVFGRARSRIGEALENAGITVEDSARKGRDIHFWRSMVALDARDEHAGAIRNWLGLDYEDEQSWTATAQGVGFQAHVSELRDVFDDLPDSSTISPAELDGLTVAALASPAICALRALLRCSEQLDEEQVMAALSAASRVAHGFRSRFNQPWIIEMLQRQSTQHAYWETVLEYCRRGNIQAMLDEYFHLLRESEGLFDSSFSKIATTLGSVAHSVLAIRSASLEYRAYDSVGDDDGGTIRTHVALRFGDDKRVADESSLRRANIVQDAFNSPFFPFVLATTSIGQEGLDFHLYCHRIYHWNLPSNPVDLEQREGRINRYKGHMIRRNLATHFGECLDGSHDPWTELFRRAEEYTRDKTRGLKPNWIFEPSKDKTPYRLQRVVPSVPYSRDEHRLADLTRTVLFYRMAFGQPRQQDLVEFLQEKYAHLSHDEIHAKIKDFWMDLSP